MVDLPLHVGPGLCLCLVLVCATGLVLDGLLAVCLSVCLTACRRRDKEGKWLPSRPDQHPSSLRPGIHIMVCQITTATPCASHTTHPSGASG